MKVADPDEYIPLIHCIMGSEDPPTSADFCLETLAVASTTPDRVRKCAEGEVGDKLLYQYGVETHGLDPPLTGVPWLLFNQEFSMDNWIDGMNDLKGLLCGKFLSESEQCQ